MRTKVFSRSGLILVILITVFFVSIEVGLPSPLGIRIDPSVPTVFDSVAIVTDGYFGDLCWLIIDSSIYQDENTFIVTIVSHHPAPSIPCQLGEQYYHSRFKVGMLPEGKFRVQFLEVEQVDSVGITVESASQEFTVYRGCLQIEGGSGTVKDWRTKLPIANASICLQQTQNCLNLTKPEDYCSRCDVNGHFDILPPCTTLVPEGYGTGTVIHLVVAAEGYVTGTYLANADPMPDLCTPPEVVNLARDWGDIFLRPSVTAVDEEIDGSPISSFDLSPNYPNPFNPRTTIEFAVPRRAHVTLEVINLTGQHVASLLDGDLLPAKHHVEWDGKNDAGRDVASGVYFYRLVTENQSAVRKMLLLR